jgi:hypothetical protein
VLDVVLYSWDTDLLLFSLSFSLFWFAMRFVFVCWEYMWMTCSPFEEHENCADRWTDWRADGRYIIDVHCCGYKFRTGSIETLEWTSRAF